MARPPQILLIENELPLAEIVCQVFESADTAYRVTVTACMAEARQILSEMVPDLVIADLTLPDGKCTELLPKESAADFPLIVITSYGDHQAAVEAMKAGALDYVVKSEANLNDMPHIAERSLREWNHIQVRARLETQYQQAQKMQAIGTLAGGIAHDFNNLLMGIQGNVSLMLTDIEQTHPHYDRLNSIESFVRSGSLLTRQLLDFARGGMVRVEPTDMNNLIDKTATLFGRTRKQIQIHKKLQKGLWAVEVDRGQIEQTLLNLFVNAWQAMPDGGRLLVQTENVIFNEDRAQAIPADPTRYIRVTVTDTGIGMNPSILDRIFEPFFSTKEGPGLGLASAYGIISNHGGSIDVSSTLNEGSTFAFLLPVTDKTVVLDDDPPDPLLRGSETILLIDDEPGVREVAESMIRKLGYTVLTAQTGAEGIELFRTHPGIDLVVLEILMPDMSGREVLDRLQKIQPKVKVLLATGYSSDGEASKLLNQGFTGFIQKPFSLRILSQKIRTFFAD